MNNFYTHDVQDIILSNSLTRLLWEARTSILEDKKIVVPEPLQEFFAIYAKGVNSKSIIETNEERINYVPMSETMAIMYSQGSESKFMEHTFCSADCITGYNFFDYMGSRNKREFQLALLGMALGYAVTMIGIHGNSLPGMPITNSPDTHFEFTDEWINLWNRTFPQTTIQYPLILITKTQIYEVLLSEGIDWEPCEEPHAPCGSCWNCQEKAYFLTGLGKEVPFVMDPATSAHCKLENCKILYDGFPDSWGTVAMLKSLERTHGYVNWRYTEEEYRLIINEKRES